MNFYLQDITKKGEKEEENVFNNVTCILPEQPEGNVFVNDTNETVKKRQKRNGPYIEVAPGENRDLSDWIRQIDFDVIAFFFLHPTGKNGIYQKREVPLTKARYIDQRINNQNSQWAKNATYVFVAQQYLEKLRVERQISISMQKGKVRLTEIGKSIIQSISETLSIFKDIPGTPSYWRMFRNEILARIEQLGPFHFFYTLSCAEMRWIEVLSSLLRNEGHKINFHYEPKDGKFLEKVVSLYYLALYSQHYLISFT